MRIATTLIGLENILKEESKGKVIYPGRVVFSKGKLKSALLIYDYITSFHFKNEDDIYNNLKKIDFKINKDFIARVCRVISAEITNSHNLIYAKKIY